MTKNEAIKFSRETGKPITHIYFSDNEFIKIIGNQVITEEDYKMWVSEFFLYREGKAFDEDWSEFKTE